MDSVLDQPDRENGPGPAAMGDFKVRFYQRAGNPRPVLTTEAMAFAITRPSFQDGTQVPRNSDTPSEQGSSFCCSCLDCRTLVRLFFL